MSVADVAAELVRARPDALLVIVGPTASGKTALAVEVAERVGGEVVSADSVQVYRGFDIGSGKPSAEELARAPHHLVSVAEPGEAMDASVWAQRAGTVIEDVRARGRVPIVCGGTFLWVKALLYGLAEVPAASEAVRARLRADAEREGRPALHARLREVDPASAARLHPNDFVRVSRALEAWELTGKPMSAWQAEHGFAEARRSAQLVALPLTAEALTARIQARVRGMLDAGWVAEVEALLTQGHGGARAMGSVGYAQVHAMLRGEVPRGELFETIVRATRVFARRQRTWLNHADVRWLDPAARVSDSTPS